LEDSVFQTKSLWKAGAQKQGLIIDVAVSCQDDATVLGDSGELRSVLFNLIKNSVEAMPKGGKINVDARKDDEDIVLTVADTGMGMDEYTRSRVFQPFFTTKDFGQGRGFGMNAVHALIVRHSGSIRIKESVEGVGTTVEIRLPSVENKPILKKEASVENIKSARVLWVDDDKIIRELGKRLLKNWGHSSTLVSSGQEALKLLESNEYDMMIVDIGMPGMNGYSLLEKIKDKYEDMKRIVLSGWIQDISADRKNNLKIERFLEKPMDTKRIQGIIHEMMQDKQE
jgi:CheY-like chemotaxis protein/anti-sigma regulatory factor (Ser/Thr protein kinase)